MTAPAPTIESILQGRRILVAEDEYMIAQEIVEMLLQAGAKPLGPVPRVSDAMRLVAEEDRIDAALLDVNLSNEAVWPVADMLLARGVTLILATGYDASTIPPAYASLPCCEKPATAQELTRALVRALNVAARM